MSYVYFLKKEMSVIYVAYTVGGESLAVKPHPQLSSVSIYLLKIFRINIFDLIFIL